MAEIGIYGHSAGWGQKARLSAIARYLPLSDVMVYTLDGGRGNAPYDYFGIPWVAVKCETPGCGGVSPQKFATFIADRRPGTLIMDAWPYGAFTGEMAAYVRARGSARTFFTCRRNPYIEAPDYFFNPSDFEAVLKFENESPIPGIDLHPIVPFEPHEILPRDEARLHLGAGERPLVLILSSGHDTPDMVKFTRDECERLGINYTVWSEYPAMPYFAGADLVVTFAGSVVTELQAVGVPYQAVAASDSADQRLRANTTPQGLKDALAHLEVLEPWTVSYENHARRAAARIMGNREWESVDG